MQARIEKLASKATLMNRVFLIVWILLTVMAKPSRAVSWDNFKEKQRPNSILNLHVHSTTDTTVLKARRSKRSQTHFNSYHSYQINSDSILKDRGFSPFLWVDSFRNLQNLMTSKPLIWSPKILIKSMPESELTNLLADMLLFESRQIWDSIDAALLNPGGIRAGFPADTLRLMHVMEVLPFPNRLDRITLTGGDLKQLLDHWAAKGGVAASGLRMTIKEGKATDILVGNEPIQLNQTYRIALPDYLVDGGDGCSFLMGSQVQRGAFRITDLVAAHLEKWGSSGAPLKTQMDGRIRVQ
jgi:hypothetical protein